MPKPRTGTVPGQYAVSLLCDDLMNGASLPEALAGIGFTYAQHVRAREKDKGYRDQTDSALRYRSVLLLEQMHGIAESLRPENAADLTSVSVAAAKTRLEALRQLSLAHEITPSAQRLAAESKGETSGLVDLLRRLDIEESAQTAQQSTEPLD